MSANITINGNINVYFNGNGQPDVEFDVGDDLTAENMQELINNIFNAVATPAEEKKERKLNINAPEFIPSFLQKRVVDDDCSCFDSECDDDSDYVPDEDTESTSDVSEDEKDEFIEKSGLFKKVCASNKVDYSLDLFQKYLRWDENTSGKGSNRYQKMTEFIKNNSPTKKAASAVVSTSSDDGKEALRLVKEVINVMKEAYGGDKKSETPKAATEKKAEPVRDAGKVKLFKQICDESGDPYSNALFDRYEEWSKTNGSGINRYKKMHKFLDYAFSTKSDNGDRA
jgi:hypothetical protein